MSMPIVTAFIGTMLVALGLNGYLGGTPDPETGKVSMTALIPAIVGAILLVCGLAAYYLPKARKHIMHLAVVVGLLGFLGGFMPLIRSYNKTGTLDITKPAVGSGGVMILLCGALVVLCVKSFIDARKARQQQPVG